MTSPEGYPVNEAGQRICASPIAGKPGYYCESPFINNRNFRCKKHGGRSLFGAASPRFKNRGYSKYLPGRMQASYKPRLAEESLSLRGEAALLGARIDDLLQRVDTGESGSLWKSLRQCGQDLLKAREAQDAQAVADFITLLLDLIEKGAAEHQLWAEIISLSMKKSKLMATEHRMLVDAQQLMSLDMVLAIMSGFIDAVSTVETDRAKLAAIHREFVRVIPPGLLTDGSVDEAEV